ncbi:MAG: family 43 glycosylhydrolase [Paenibacillus sp.]|jgi:beta-xylosidase|nr:family 43 glycosylhydrolase [Paenibacillus sp.]
MNRKNPVLPGTWADPYIFRDGSDYYLYPTKDSEGWMYDKFHVFHSTDLRTWSEPAAALDLSTVSWAGSKAWAPSVAKFNGGYYMYFCAEQQIGVAGSDSPAGPFKDLLGKPLIGKDEWHCQSIDPDVFIDSDGQPYLLWGQGKCWIAPLEADMISFKEQPRCLSDPLYRQYGKDPNEFDISIYNEGAHLQNIDGTYILTWSIYDTRDVRYQVRYAVSRSVFGPYEAPGHNVIIEPANGAAGTGHASMTLYNGEWYLFYHRMGQGRAGYVRQVCCDKLEFINGRPATIIQQTGRPLHEQAGEGHTGYRHRTGL